MLLKALKDHTREVDVDKPVMPGAGRCDNSPDRNLGLPETVDAGCTLRHSEADECKEGLPQDFKFVG